MSKPQRMLTTGEIAKYCNVSFITVIRWIDKGRLKGYQLPGRGDRRVSENDFVDFLKTNKMPIPDDFIEEDDSKKVLVVDDDEAIARAINLILVQAGYEVIVANDGFTAGQMVEKFSPSLMTLDLKMPGIPGLNVIKNIKKEESLAGTKILVVSGMPAESLENALAFGADDVLPKPFKTEDLIAKVNSLMDNTEVNV